MSDLSIQGEVVVNSEKAESAFDRVGDKATQMANEVAASAGKAGQAVDKIGDGAGASAEKFTRAESRISASIKRATNELELLGKTASQRLEFNIADKGLDAAKFEPALKKLREIEAQALQAQRAATGSLDKMGISAGQTAAALRQLPAQFTDIVTSLQGGQAPLTVLLQQGGQIKDSFGGAGSAVRALGGYVAGLVNPFTMAAAAIATIAVAYKQGSAEADGYRMALVMTGNAAGTTAAQMQQMAGRISSVVGTQAAAAETLAGLAGSSRIAAENFEYFGTVALKVEKTVGTSVAETVKQFAELGKAPVEASKKLNEETNYLTQSIYEQIKALKEQGRESDAASVAQKAWADSLNNRSAEMTQNLGLIEKAWKGVAGAAKSGWDAMLNVGRSSSMADQLANVRQQIAQAQGQDKNRPFSLPWDTPLADLQQRLSYLTEEERLMKRGAAAQAERAQAEKAAIEATDALGKVNEKALSKQEQMNKALEDYRANLEKVRAVNPNSSLLDPAQISKSEKAIREQFAERTKAVASGNSELQKQADLIAKLSGLDPSFSREWEILSKAYKSGELSLDELVQKQAELLARQPAMTAQIKAQAEAEKERAKSAADLAKTLEAYAKAQQEGVAQGFQAAQQAEDQLAQYGMLKSEVQALTLAYLEQSRESAALAGEDVSNIDKRIAAQKRLISATSGIEQRDAAKKAAQDAEAEWKRTADSINQSLTDALLRGFESGKDFAKNMRDTVVNMFKTMVLRPVVSAIVSPVAGAITGALGLSTAAQAGQGGASSGVSTALSGASLLGSVGGSLAAGAGWLTGATTLGGSLSAGMSLLGTGSLAGAGAGLGMLAGALGPIALGIGLLSSAFSRKLKDQGIQGTLGGEAGFEGQQYRFYEGGLFRSDKTTYSAVDPELARVLAGSFSAVQDQVTDFAEALSLPTDRIKRFTTDIKVSFNGLDDAGIQKALQDALATGSNELAQQVLGTLTTTTREVTETLAGGMGDWGDGTMQTVTRTIEETTYAASEYAKEGEQAIDTLTRLATSLGTVNDIWKNLGYTVYEASLAGADAASKMADAFGGLEAMAQATGTYFENFYSAEEQRAAVERQLNEALGKLNLQLPDIDATDARAQYRALAEAQDRNTEAGREAYAVLLKLSGAFASVTAESETAAAAAARLADEQAKAAKEAQDAYQKQARAAQEAADAARRAHEDLLEALTKAAEQALKILGNAIDAEKKVQQAEYDAQMVIIDAQRKASTTFVEAQRAWLNVAIDSTKNYAKALESEATRIRGFFTGMVLQDDPDAPAGASVFSAQAALRAGDTSDAVLRKATDIDPEMFSSWADYAINFFDTKSIVDQYATQAERAASVAASDVALLEQQLTKAEEQYQADLDHYTRLEGIAKDTLEANILRLDGILQAAQDQLAEATGTKLAVLGLGAALGNFAGAVARLSDVTKNPVTTPLSTTAPVLTTYGTADRADAFVAQVTAYNPVISGATSSSTNNQVVDVLREVVAELQALRVSGADTKAAVEKTSAILDLVTAGGNAMLTETA